jgi:uncharacterized protein (DUF1697 family)
MRSGLAQQLYDAAQPLVSPSDEIALGNNVIYWKVPKGETLETPFAKLLTQPAFKQFHTSRNLKTLRKLLPA